jgi:preprotein translocase subunit YajC
MGILSAAEAASAAKPSSNDGFTFVLLIILVFVALYFVMIRPQRRRQQQAMQQQQTVAPGAQVRTTAGMYATVVEVDGDDVVLEVAPGVEVRYMKRAIMEVISSGGEYEESTDSEYTEDDGETEDDADSAEDGLTDEDSPDLASSNGTKAKSDSDVF